MAKNKKKRARDDHLDGCDIDYPPAKDEEVEALLVPAGKEQRAWSEEEESDGP